MCLRRKFIISEAQLKISVVYTIKKYSNLHNEIIFPVTNTRVKTPSKASLLTLRTTETKLHSSVPRSCQCKHRINLGKRLSYTINITIVHRKESPRSLTLSIFKNPISISDERIKQQLRRFRIKSKNEITSHSVISFSKQKRFSRNENRALKRKAAKRKLIEIRMHSRTKRNQTLIPIC